MKCRFSGFGQSCSLDALRGYDLCVSHLNEYGPLERRAWQSSELNTNNGNVSNNGGSSSYYELPPNCETLQDIIVGQDMGFTQGNIFKAAYRWDKKPDLEYNLNKIIWFAQDALDRIHAQDPNNPRGSSYEDKSD